MKPSMVLEEQVNLLRWWRTDFGHRFADNFIKVISAKAEADGTESVFAQGWDGHYLSETNAHHLDRAETYWVSKAMTELVDQAARSMAPEALFESVLPSRTGFVWFDKLVHSLDANMKWVNTRAISWAPIRVHYTDTSDYDDGVVITLYSDTLDVGFDETLLEAESTAGYPRLLMLHSQPWVFGRTFAEEEDSARTYMIEQFGEEPPEDWVSSMAHMSRFLFAFWKLIQMPIAVEERHQPDRASRRRLARNSITLPNDEVRVITLRKTRPHQHDTDEGDQEAIEWSHRWLVSGHWRWQWYPSRQRHEQIWISPFVKGPEDRPLILKDRVYAWRK